ncbi:hypothetical protein DERP_004923 [Dermatophagoides pteronyssinus]|uniref:Uncharacterized protein n=1 Tax=Dermatophagoides pteronyssinus TaxID=6956 RepID=A0ABQ8JSX9_DERPT|nr:hypothetical protein DERP_004923 [Dermatophagoides pteronyssinus]
MYILRVHLGDAKIDPKGRAIQLSYHHHHHDHRKKTCIKNMDTSEQNKPICPPIYINICMWNLIQYQYVVVAEMAKI